MRKLGCVRVTLMLHLTAGAGLGRASAPLVFLQHGSERDHTSQSRSMLLYVMKLHMNVLKRI